MTEYAYIQYLVADPKFWEELQKYPSAVLLPCNRTVVFNTPILHTDYIHQICATKHAAIHMAMEYGGDVICAVSYHDTGRSSFQLLMSIKKP